MKKPVGRVRSVAGLTLIAVGVAGVVLPLMPGVPFLIAGTALLGSDHPISRAVAERIRRLTPRRGKKGVPSCGGPPSPKECS